MEDKRIFTQIPNPVIKAMCTGEITSQQARVLMALYAHHNPKTQEPVRPSRETIKKWTGMTFRNISAATSALEKKRWLVKIIKYGVSARYFLFWNRPLPAVGAGSMPDGVPVSESDTTSGVGGTPVRFRPLPLSESDTLTYKEHTVAANTGEKGVCLEALQDEMEGDRYDCVPF